MPLYVKKPDNKGSFELMPAGIYQAVCYGVWDLGNQKTVWNGQEKTQHKVVISWEINKTIESEGEYKGKRFVISNRYTFSLSEKSNLRKHLESWSGQSLKEYEDKGFDLEQLIGKNCMISIIHNEKGDKTYANVSAVLGCPDGTQKMIPENTTEPPEWVKKIQAEQVRGVEQATDVDFAAADFTPLAEDEVPL